MRIIELIQKNRHIKLAGNEKLRIERALASRQSAGADGAGCVAQPGATPQPGNGSKLTLKSGLSPRPYCVISY
jgi:hypothetical protein